jgi:hypothetical protein
VTSGSANAFKIDMRRNSKFALMALVGVVGLVAFSVVMTLVPTSGPIRLELQSYTNACAGIAIINQSSLHFDYTVMAERKIGGKWPEGLAPGTMIPAHQSGSLGPGQHTNLTVSVMVYVPSYSWRISVFCTRPPVQPNSVRFRAALWCGEHGLRKMAHKLFGRDSIQVSTPEMEQWERRGNQLD